ncbi:hypothetical protein NJB1907Z4_C15650 [Mycobacterium pseudoshottsii]|uniref:Uncharacterized protein n=1 Tax=Mycobacterium pseudoshottsii TaxID=265949 RepID=A0A9N7QLZ0_9MYCO|nr:hypothetical protein NJB1907Z4_C15650 [Mycobacterium pseudoshottsii]
MTSAARSVNRCVTCKRPRRALTAQFTARSWSPRNIGANVGVFDAWADVPGEVGTQPVEQLGLRNGRRLRRCERKDDHLGGLDRPIAYQQPAARDDIDARLDGIAAPPPCHHLNAFYLA